MWTLQPFNPTPNIALTSHFWENPESTGTGTLLFVPGLAGSIQMATAFLDRVKRRFQRVIGIDLRSFGVNHSIVEASPKLWLEDLTALYNELARRYPEEPLSVAGISLGGVLTTHWVAQGLANQTVMPQELLLLAPAFLPHPKRFPLSYALKQAARLLIGGPNTRLTLPYNASAITRYPEGTGNAWQTPHQVPVRLMLGIDALAKAAVKLAPKLTLPVMIVVPEQDSVCDPGAMLRFAQRLPAGYDHRVLRFPEAYHDIILEPEMPDVAEAFVQWHSQQPVLTP